MTQKDWKNISWKAKYLSILSSIITLVQWSIIISCLICLIVQVVNCIEKYAKKDTRVIQTVMPLKNASFLAFTVCPSYDEAYKLQVLQSYGTTKDIYKKGKTIVFTFYSILHFRLSKPFPLPLTGNFTVNTNESPKQVFIDITYELHELLEYIIVHTDNFSNHDVSIDLKEKSNIVKIDTMPIKTFGRCYAIQLGKEIVSQGVHAIDFLSNMNLYVYFHHPGQFLSIDTKSKLYTLKGRNHFMDMTYSIMKNTLRSESTIPCSGDTNFEFDNCFYQAIAQDLTNKLNCVVPFIKTSENKNICVNKAQTEIDQMMLALEKSLTTTGPCISPCTSMNIFFGVLFDDAIRNDEKSFLRIYFKSNIKFQQTIYDYTLLSLLAEIGGYTGLLLGISVANITTVIEKMFQWFNLVA